MRPVTKQLMRNIRNKEQRPREVRFHEIRIKQYTVYSLDSISKELRKPVIFTEKDEALRWCRRLRIIGCHVIMEMTNQMVRVKAHRFHFPGEVHPSWSNGGLRAIA